LNQELFEEFCEEFAFSGERRAECERGQREQLAAMLRATVETRRSSESDDLSLQVSLVAGCRTLLHIVAFCNPFLNAAVYSGAPQPDANLIAYLQIR